MRARRVGVRGLTSPRRFGCIPKSDTVIANTALAQVGNIEIIPPEPPLTLFLWGRQRVLPVGLTSFSITEQAYDTLLNPILAKVD